VAQSENKDIELACRTLEMSQQMETQRNELTRQISETTAQFEEKASEVAAELARTSVELATKIVEVARLKVMLQTAHPVSLPHQTATKPNSAVPPKNLSSTPHTNQNPPVARLGGLKGFLVLAQQDRYLSLARFILFIFLVMFVLVYICATCKPCSAGRRFVAHIQ